MGFLGNLLMGLFLDKKARTALKGRQAVRRPGAGPASARDEAIAQVQAQGKDFVTPERAELIRQAMAVRKAKQTILADLNDEQRQKLVAMAMKKLLNEGREG